MAENRRAGTMFFKVDGTLRDAKGNFTYNLGGPKREGMIGTDLTNQGYKETGQIAYVEGEITDQGDLSLADFINIENATITLELANGKVVTFRNAYYAADGNVGTEDANIQVRFEAKEAEEGAGSGSPVNSAPTGIGGSDSPGESDGLGGFVGDFIDAVFA